MADAIDEIEDIPPSTLDAIDDWPEASDNGGDFLGPPSPSMPPPKEMPPPSVPAVTVPAVTVQPPTPQTSQDGVPVGPATFLDVPATSSATAEAPIPESATMSKSPTPELRRSPRIRSRSASPLPSLPKKRPAEDIDNVPANKKLKDK